MNKTPTLTKNRTRSPFITLGLWIGLLVVVACGYEAYIPGGIKKNRCPFSVETTLDKAGIPFRSCEYDESGNYFLNLTGKAVTNLIALKSHWYPAVVQHHRERSTASAKDAESPSPKLWLFLAKTRISDLEPLKGLPVTGLDISETGVSELSPLTNAPLEMLKIRGSAVKDLTPISECPLNYVDLRNTSIADLKPLERCPVERLWLDGSDVEDLSPLKDLPLNFVSFQDTEVTDTTPLGAMKIMLTTRGGVAVTDQTNTTDHSRK